MHPQPRIPRPSRARPVREQVTRHVLPLAVAAPWAVWAGLRTRGAERGFPLVPAMAFTPYAAATALLPLGTAVLRRSAPATAVAGLAAAVLTGTALGGRAPAPTPVVPAGRRLRLGTVNLLLGRADPAGVLDLVRAHDLDVLAVEELTPRAEERLRAAGIGDLLPHSHVIAARDGNPPAAGGAVWSRLPVLERRAAPGRFEQPSVRLAVAGAPDVEVTAVHTQPPARSRQEVARWEDDLGLLPDPDTGVLRVLAGDYNATLDHAGFRRLLDRGYVDAARAVGRAHLSTWRPLRAPHPRLTLDHVLVDPRIGVCQLDVLPVSGSDHRAVVVELALPPLER